MPSSYVYTGQKAADESKASAANKRQNEMKGSTINQGLGDLIAKNKKSASTAPKQSDFGGDLKAYGEAMRKYRSEMDSNPDNLAQKKALSR